MFLLKKCLKAIEGVWHVTNDRIQPCWPSNFKPYITITDHSDYFLAPFHCLLFGVRHYLVFNSSATIWSRKDVVILTINTVRGQLTSPNLLHVLKFVSEYVTIMFPALSSLSKKCLLTQTAECETQPKHRLWALSLPLWAEFSSLPLVLL